MIWQKVKGRGRLQLLRETGTINRLRVAVLE